MELVLKKYYAFHEKNGFYVHSDGGELFRLQEEMKDVWMEIDELIEHHEWVVNELREFKERFCDTVPMGAQEDGCGCMLVGECCKQVKQ